jgi:hypothetical protein
MRFFDADAVLQQHDTGFALWRPSHQRFDVSGIISDVW